MMSMDEQEVIDQLNAILDVLGPTKDGRHGLSEPRRRLIIRLVKKLRDEIEEDDG